jgi:hypothetical protein
MISPIIAVLYSCLTKSRYHELVIKVAKQTVPKEVLDRIQKQRLPTNGQHPFIPKWRVNKRGKPDLILAPLTRGRKKGEKGFLDSQDRIWIRDKAHANVPDHWDVEENGGQSYFRVDDNGNIIP